MIHECKVLVNSIYVHSVNGIYKKVIGMPAVGVEKYVYMVLDLLMGMECDCIGFK